MEMQSELIAIVDGGSEAIRRFSADAYALFWISAVLGR